MTLRELRLVERIINHYWGIIESEGQFIVVKDKEIGEALFAIKREIKLKTKNPVTGRLEEDK